MSNSVYSYHTFVFPFIFRSDNGIDGFHSRLDMGQKGWVYEKWDHGKERVSLEGPEKPIVFYNKWQYFHDSARNVIFGIDKNISRNYTRSIGPNVQYVIRKGEKTWTLRVNAIRLKLFNTNVGVLIFELENINHRTMDDVLKINEYGRRIYFPYIAPKYGEPSELDCALTADRITIDTFESNYANELKGWTKSSPNTQFISPIIEELLGEDITFRNTSYWLTPNASSREKQIICEPVSDDRMFTCCVVHDENREFLRQIGSWNAETKRYAWEEEVLEKPYNDKTLSKLYDFIFIDGDGLSCIGREKRLELIKRHLDTRWMEYIPEEALNAPDSRTKITYGSFFAATDHSMVSVVNWDGEIPAFLTMRVEMAILALAQRTSIIALGRKAGKVSQSFNADGRIKGREIREITKLQERYVAFLNQLYLFEVTAQEQGTDNYALLRESLHIEDEIEQLERQLRNLYDIANVNANDRLNARVLFLTVIGGIASLAGIWDLIHRITRLLK